MKHARIQSNLFKLQRFLTQLNAPGSLRMTGYLWTVYFPCHNHVRIVDIVLTKFNKLIRFYH